MTKEQVRTIMCALFHEGIEVDRLSESAKDELRKAVEVLLAAHSRS